ncbi:MAG: Uma2 family endonuclease [Gemmatimonadaceae bacterium]|nr:Uma2 family endonuclease [Gloeobacterales cyanobacterium ES-bin-141]
MAMTIEDVEKIQQLYPDHRIELRDGAVIVISPSDITSGIVGGKFLRLLGNWVDPHGLGYVADASAGYRSPNGDLTAPDVSFVSRERLGRSPRTYAQVVPNLVVEVKSSTDRIKLLVEKLQMYLELGAQTGILLDPDKQTLSVYRPEQAALVLGNGDTLTLPEFPGWELNVVELWPPVFER